MQQSTILETTETQTPDNRVICDTFSGKWTLLCGQYTDSPVKIQIRLPGSTQWQNCMFAGEPIEFTEAGESVEIPVTPCIAYRCQTAEAGAEIIAFPNLRK